MTDRAPIPAETFDDAVDRLDRDALAEFVGRLEAAAGGTVEVDPPIVAVGDGDDRERLLVAPDASDPDSVRAGGTAPDAVVVPDGAAAADYEVPVRTAEDLRHQLLYAASPEAASSIAEEWLGTPARSTSYPPEPTPSAPTDRDADVDATATDPGTSPERPADPIAGSPDGQRTSPTSDTGSGPGTAAGSNGGSSQNPPDQPDREDDPAEAAATWSGAGFVVVGALAVMIVAVAGGVVYAAEVSPNGDAGAFAAPASTEGGGISEAELRRRSRGPLDENGAVITPEEPAPSGENGSDGRPLVADTEANRNVRPVPNCNRSFLHVVQIQMNALKYNNNSTDNGIRTVRRFASPRNRRAIQTFSEFARIIKNPTYSPMLSYDSVQYTPIQSSGDYAQVQVITREDGNVTGQYYFRVRKIDGGTYDGCWMTDAVVSVPETTNFSGEVAGQSTGSSNVTS